MNKRQLQRALDRLDRLERQAVDLVREIARSFPEEEPADDGCEEDEDA